MKKRLRMGNSTSSAAPTRSKSEQVMAPGPGRSESFLRHPKKSLSASFRLLKRSPTTVEKRPASQTFSDSQIGSVLATGPKISIERNDASPSVGSSSPSRAIKNANSVTRKSSNLSGGKPATYPSRKLSKMSASSMNGGTATTFTARNSESKLTISRQDSVGVDSRPASQVIEPPVAPAPMAFKDYTLVNTDDPRRLNTIHTAISSRKKDPKLTPAQRDLIKECWETTKHNEFGTRLYNRYFQKRPDIRRIFEDIERIKPDYSWKEESKEFNNFLHALIDKMDDTEAMAIMSRDWGSRFVSLRDYGFKPSFWVPFSEIMTTECLYLDAGVHPVADMVGAWATLFTIMLGHMRDGFYSQLRYLRRQSKRRQSTWTNMGLMPPEFDYDQLSNSPSALSDEFAMRSNVSQNSISSSQQVMADQATLGQLIHTALVEAESHQTDHYRGYDVRTEPARGSFDADPASYDVIEVTVSEHPETFTTAEDFSAESTGIDELSSDYDTASFSPYHQNHSQLHHHQNDQHLDISKSPAIDLPGASELQAYDNRKHVGFHLDPPESASPRDGSSSVYHTPPLTNRAFVPD